VLVLLKPNKHNFGLPELPPDSKISEVVVVGDVTMVVVVVRLLVGGGTVIGVVVAVIVFGNFVVLAHVLVDLVKGFHTDAVFFAGGVNCGDAIVVVGSCGVGIGDIVCTVESSVDRYFCLPLSKMLCIISTSFVYLFNRLCISSCFSIYMI
jgi:hypothetical protein